jgi:RNA polymerase sigma factor (sigma-70 family)
MGEPVKRLSTEEKAFAEKNIGILFAFMRRYHLPEDYFGALAIVYVRFVGEYMREREKYCYSFSTLVWQRLRSELSHITRRENSEIVLPLDCGELSGREDDYFVQELICKVSDELTPKQAQTLLLRIEGYSNAEIAQALGISESTVEKCFQRIRRIYREIKG